MHGVPLARVCEKNRSLKGDSDAGLGGGAPPSPREEWLGGGDWQSTGAPPSKTALSELATVAVGKVGPVTKVLATFADDLDTSHVLCFPGERRVMP